MRRSQRDEAEVSPRVALVAPAGRKCHRVGPCTAIAEKRRNGGTWHPRQEVASLSHLVELLEGRGGESHRIMLEDGEYEIVLRHEDVDRRNQEILDRYRIPADRSPDLMAMKPSATTEAISETATETSKR